MLPLAWAATRGAGTGVVPAVLLLAVFASSSAYTLYLAAQLAEAGREARRAAPALSELWRGAKLPLPKAVDAMVALLCGGCCVFYAAFAADLFYALAKRLGLGTSREMVLGVLDLYTIGTIMPGRRPERAQVLVARRVAGNRLHGVVHWSERRHVGRRAHTGHADLLRDVRPGQYVGGGLPLPLQRGPVLPGACAAAADAGQV